MNQPFHNINVNQFSQQTVAAVIKSVKFCGLNVNYKINEN